MRLKQFVIHVLAGLAVIVITGRPAWPWSVSIDAEQATAAPESASDAHANDWTVSVEADQR